MSRLTVKKLLAFIAFLFFLNGFGSVVNAGEPTISAPVPGSQLSGDTETFRWNANGAAVSAWSLYVGTTVGGNDILRKGLNVGTTSLTVSNLPTDGSTVWVRLRWYVSGSWQFVDFQYTSDIVNITVAAPAPAPTLSFSASVTQDGSTTLNWNSTEATSCVASGAWSGNKATSGSQTMSSLTSDKVFNLSCSGPGGTSSDIVNVTVTAPAPTLSFSASVTQNGSTTLNWNSTDATSCVASGDWSGNKATSGSQTMSSLTSDKVFNLSCSGPGGTSSDIVNITVAAPAPAPTLSFSASPASVTQNGSTTLNWNSTDATSCVASGDWSGNKGASGSESTGALTIVSQYTLTCSSLGGSVNQSVNVTVVLSSNGTALLSWTPPTENTDTSTLTDLAGYKIYYGTSPGNYSNTEIINNPGLSSYLVENLASADWYFVMTSFSDSGIESDYSTEVSKTIN